jgi:hypothetical protein
VCTVIKALKYKIQSSEHAKNEIKTIFRDTDLLGCLVTTDASEIRVLDHLLRNADKMVRGYTFELLAAISAYQEGKKYLLSKLDLVEMLIADLTQMDAQKCAVDKS